MRRETANVVVASTEAALLAERTGRRTTGPGARPGDMVDRRGHGCGGHNTTGKPPKRKR